MLYGLLAHVVAALIFVTLPSILRALGFYLKYEGKQFNLEGKKYRSNTTSKTTPAPKKNATGILPSELTVLYYAFKNAGMDVDLASIQGGKIPLEKYRLR